METRAQKIFKTQIMKFYIKICLLLFILSSCNPNRYIYIGESDLEKGDSNLYALQKTTYYLQLGDIIYVSMHSTLSETEGMFHFPGQESVSNSSSGIQGGSMYLNQSVIDDQGYIRFPVLGMIYAAGSTIEELEAIIEKEAQKYVDDALARVKLVSYEITFMGEFGITGKINFYKDRVHILNAIAQAGEVTYYADRKNIRILRQTPDGLTSYRIDLTDKALLTSDKFYLQPNDIVYAEPLPRKIFRVNVSDYSLAIATISSTIAFIALIVSLNK